MTQFLYTAGYVMRRAGRKSPSAGVQLQRHLPSPEGVLVSDRAAAAWTLKTWRSVAQTRRLPLREDLLATLDELEEEQAALTDRYVTRWYP